MLQAAQKKRDAMNLPKRLNMVTPYGNEKTNNLDI